MPKSTCSNDNLIIGYNHLVHFAFRHASLPITTPSLPRMAELSVTVSNHLDSDL
jgi:hypothetical protein